MAAPEGSTTDGWALLLCCALLAIRQMRSGIDLISLLMLVPLVVCLIPSLDSLQRTGEIRQWNRWHMRFEPLSKELQPFQYWLNLLVSWPAAVFFAYALVMMPKR